LGKVGQLELLPKLAGVLVVPAVVFCKPGCAGLYHAQRIQKNRAAKHCTTTVISN